MSPHDSDHLDRTIPRRALLGAAAWSVPAVGVVFATPARAASTPVSTVAFDKPTYQAACGAFGTAVVRVTVDGAPASGVPVGVALGTGLSWPDGSTGVRVLPTDVTGSVEVAGHCPIQPGAYGMTATLTTGEQARSQVVAETPPAAAWSREGLAEPVRFTAVPSDSRAIASDVFLSTGGQLWIRNERVATGVTTAVAESSDSVPTASFIGSDGVAVSVTAGGATTRFTAVPSTATPIGRHTFLDRASGVVWVSGEAVLHGVATAHAMVDAADRVVVSSMSTSGTASSGRPEKQQTWSRVPPSAEPVGRDLFLTPDGQLFVGDTLVVSGARSAASDTNHLNERIVSWTDDAGAHSGTAGISGSSGFSNQVLFTGVPLDARAVSRDTFLTPAGDLYVGDDLVASPVSSAAAETVDAADDIVTSYTIATC